MALGANVSAEISKEIPEKYEGYLMKKKKWPLKGWHRRYFFLEAGLLKYAKSPQSLTKNKLHGLMDMGLSVMSTKKNSFTIDLDAEDIIFHLKAKSSNLYQLWMSKLRLHRDFRLHELNKDSTLTHHATAVGDSKASPLVYPANREAGFIPSQDRSPEECSSNLKQAQNDIWLLEKQISEMSVAGINLVSGFLTVPPPSPSPTISKKDKERKSKKASKKANKHNSIAGSVSSLSSDAAGFNSNLLSANGFKMPEPPDGKNNLSKSNPDLSHVVTPTKQAISEDEWLQNPIQTSQSVQSTPVHQKHGRSATISESSTTSYVFSNAIGDFTEKQKRFVATASAIQMSLFAILEDIKHMDEARQNQPKLAAMKNVISQLNSENYDLRYRLQRIHNESFVSDSVPPPTSVKRRLTSKTLNSRYLSESQLSICESASEMFYDAEEYLLSDEESTSSDEECETGEDEQSSDGEMSDESGSGTVSTKSLPYDVEEMKSAPGISSRRTSLPCHRPDADVSLWNILKKNIGKDLSKVSMPVTLNEPLNALQLLCEELEYSNLLDIADCCQDVHEQLVYVAAFAISAYNSTYTRAGQKPFNPILGETYECIREDRSFRFVSEQVSHHPPISACHCEGDHFEFWQDARFKNKFWGKSLEIFPVGSVHVRLKKHNRRFQWKKVTSCVHNIMAGTRWIEHYGDMLITADGGASCKVSFSKRGYWSGKNGEVSGSVADADGKVRYKLHGKWFEGIACEMDGKTKSLWKPNPMPSDYEQQYGFSRFAIELNEILPDQADLLPRTDSRFRPDQRCLENGDVQGAEEEKVRVEQLQRDQRKERESRNEDYSPIFFKKLIGGSDDDGWAFKGDYWKLRQDPGFKNLVNVPVLW